MDAAGLIEVIDNYVERKVRSIVVQLGLIAAKERTKLAILELEEDAEEDLRRAIDQLLGD